MAQQLSQKEKSLLKDQLSHEEICIKKYSNYASRAQSPELKNMFNQFASEEKRHYDTLSGFLQSAGETANTQNLKTQGQGTQNQGTQAQGAQDQETQTQGTQTWGTQTQGSKTQAQMLWETGTLEQEKASGSSAGLDTQDEVSMLSDMLMTEKFVSSGYDTAVFESLNPSLRQSLQQIQKDEQRHGEGIFRYMQRHGMYNVQ